MTDSVTFQGRQRPSRTTTADPPDSPRSVGWTHAKRMTLATTDVPFILDSGYPLAPLEVEYETYGTLNADKSNAVFIPHALTGDAHIAGSATFCEIAEPQSWQISALAELFLGGAGFGLGCMTSSVRWSASG
ncbi:MAG: hypothetical protein IKN52_13885, partial [Victivallales bacterium]|nr:hypothetical protein [Victivallales bacterium]